MVEEKVWWWKEQRKECECSRRKRIIRRKLCFLNWYQQCCTYLKPGISPSIIIDCGASSHFTPNQDKLLDYQELTALPIQAANSHTFAAHRCGNMKIFLPISRNKKPKSHPHKCLLLPILGIYTCFMHLHDATQLQSPTRRLGMHYLQSCVESHRENPGNARPLLVWWNENLISYSYCQHSISANVNHQFPSMYGSQQSRWSAKDGQGGNDKRNRSRSHLNSGILQTMHRSQSYPEVIPKSKYSREC